MYNSQAPGLGLDQPGPWPFPWQDKGGGCKITKFDKNKEVNHEYCEIISSRMIF